MPIGRLLFLAFLLIPIAEIYVLIQVGSVIGAFATIILIVFTAVLGSLLIRAQGLATLARLRAATARGEVPAVELLEGICLLAAGALLLTPGFVTDAIGFALLVPGLRRAIIVSLLERGVLRAARGAAAGPPPNREGNAAQRPGAGPGPGARTGHVIEGEFERKD